MNDIAELSREKECSEEECGSQAETVAQMLGSEYQQDGPRCGQQTLKYPNTLSARVGLKDEDNDERESDRDGGCNAMQRNSASANDSRHAKDDDSRQHQH
ncbi:MAG: hypothetical protein ACKVX7_15150 [Planctomycetota bacterium]